MLGRSGRQWVSKRTTSNSISRSTASMCKPTSILSQLNWSVKGSECILFFDFILHDGLQTLRSRESPRPLFISKKIYERTLFSLKKRLGSEGFPVRCFVVQKGDLSDSQNIPVVLQKRNDAFRQDLAKIISIPALSLRLHHLHPPSSKKDRYIDMFGIFNQFAMTFLSGISSGINDETCEWRDVTWACEWRKRKNSWLTVKW